MPRHLRCPFAGMLCTKCATTKPISALKITALTAKITVCLITIQNSSRLKRNAKLPSPTKRSIDLLRLARCRPDLRRRGTCSRAAWMTPLAMARLRAHVALEFRGGPADRLVDRIAALRAARDHLRVDRLHVHLLRDAGRSRRARHPGHLAGARRVVIHRALRRLDLLPDPEVAHALERGNVVAAACIDDLLDVRALQQMRKQALRRRLVLGKLPHA